MDDEWNAVYGEPSRVPQKSHNDEQVMWDTIEN